MPDMDDLNEEREAAILILMSALTPFLYEHQGEDFDALPAFQYIAAALNTVGVTDNEISRAVANYTGMIEGLVAEQKVTGGPAPKRIKAMLDYAGRTHTDYLQDLRDAWIDAEVLKQSADLPGFLAAVHEAHRRMLVLERIPGFPNKTVDAGEYARLREKIGWLLKIANTVTGEGPGAHPDVRR
jgi:hypothetical protein